MSSATPDRRTVNIQPPLWRALELVARLQRCSISEVLRRASEREVERYGLSIVDDELTINRALWPAEISTGMKSAGEEI